MEEVKICLISLPSPFLINDLNCVDLGILYISSYLKINGIENIQVIDLATGDAVPDVNADIIGISSTTPQFPEAVKVLKKLQSNNPDTLYVIGGPHATCRPRSCLDSGFNTVIKGEGEQAMLKIIRGKPLFMSDTNKKGWFWGIIEEPFLKNINFLPDRDAIDMSRYSYNLQGKRATNIMTSRGCPFNCAFCCKTWGQSVRFVSPKFVAEEVKLLRDKYGFEGIVFFDDEMNYNPRRLLKICKLIKPLDMFWRCLLRAKPLSPGLLREMKRSGCVEIQIGVESGSNKILKTIKKGTTVKDNLRAIKLIKKAGIHQKPLLMIGNPGESYETVEETRQFLRLIKKIDPEIDFDLMMFTPYPLSDIWENMENYDIQFNKEAVDFSKAVYKQPDPLDADSWVCSVRTSYLSSKELITLQKSIFEEFEEWGVKLARGKT